MPAYVPVYGRILNITNAREDCCQRNITISTSDGPVTVILTSDTYVIDHIRLRAGMEIVAFYDSDLPVPLIFPPQYRAVIIGIRRSGENVMINFFNRNLVASDNSLRLNMAPSTQVESANGQPFTCSVGGRSLIVFYTTTTMSLPPQTTPRRVIVLC